MNQVARDLKVAALIFKLGWSVTISIRACLCPNASFFITRLSHKFYFLPLFPFITKDPVSQFHFSITVFKLGQYS
jgi:hypothetical protein